MLWKRCVREMYRGVDRLLKQQPNLWDARRRGGIGKLDQDAAILRDLANKTRYTGSAVGLVRLPTRLWL